MQPSENMSISKQILGMNARNYLYIARYNKNSAKIRADDKLQTKKTLLGSNIPTSEIIHSFATRKGIKNYSWHLPEEGFVIKPARGFGGEGILVFKNWDNTAQTGITISGENYTLKELQSHILDIFDGIYSLQTLPDKAYIEKKITPNAFFKKLAPLGLPDIRVIVFNKVPVMAMLRLPTAESHGKANLHQGAIGVGIGMRTGITKHAVFKGKALKFIPGTKIKASGIRIPDWTDILQLSSKAQTSSGLGYAGVDIVLDEKKGPLVLEINARPGLEIQNANLSSLRTRLEMVENLKVPTPERGVEIARSLFAEDFADKVKEERKVLSVIEPVLITNNGVSREYLAKLDTGAYKTSIDISIVKELNLQEVNEKIFVTSASGQSIRPAVKLELRLGGKKISTIASVADRSKLQFPLIVGRTDLKGFYVNPLLSAEYKKNNLLENDDKYEYEDDVEE